MGRQGSRSLTAETRCCWSLDSNAGVLNGCASQAVEPWVRLDNSTIRDIVWKPELLVVNVDNSSIRVDIPGPAGLVLA